MEGNGMFPDDDQGYGNGWGNYNRRNDNQSYTQRGSYFDSQGSFGGYGSGQRVASYGYGGMDMQDDGGEFNSGGGSFRNSGYDDMNQPGGRKGFDDYNGPDNNVQQNSFNKRGNNPTAQKSLLGDYESEIAMMQGGSYAGSSSHYGKNLSSYKAMGSSDFFSHQGRPRRPFGSGNFDSGSRGLLDDSRYRLGSGSFPGGMGGGMGGGRGMGRGFGRGRGGGFRNAMRGDFHNKGQKRDGPQQGPYPKKKKSVTQGQKNPVSFLNEIRPDATFQVGDMEGSTNNPNFTISLEFDGETYTATAKSKKLAKRFVAEAALKVYLNTPAAQQLGYNESMIEFSDGPEGVIAKGAENAVTPKEEKVSTTPKAVVDDGGKNPVMHLNELRKDAVYDLKEETGQAHNKQFIMRVTVSGQTFEGSGQSKKLAKAAAAREALKELGLIKQE